VVQKLQSADPLGALPEVQVRNQQSRRPAMLAVERLAQVGTETIGYSDLVGATGRVVAFEPSPANQEALGVALARARYSNVTIHPCALGERPGRARFAVPPPDASTGIGHILGPDEARTGVITYYGNRLDAPVIDVEVRTLDSFLEDFDRVAFLVCDAEGSELPILRGARRLIERDRPPLVLEASSFHQERAGTSVAALHEELISLGYRVFEIRRLSLAEVDEVAVAGHRNWCCLQDSDLDAVPRITGLLRRGALLPCIPALNPMTRRAHRDPASNGRARRLRRHSRS
jgi:FkbM family methyltransferase